MLGLRRPMDVGQLGKVGNQLTNLVQNTRGLQRRVAEFHRTLCNCRNEQFVYGLANVQAGFRRFLDAEVMLHHHFYPAGFAD